MICFRDLLTFSHSKNIVSCIFELYCCIQKLKCRFWFIGSNLHIVVLNQKENIVSQIVILLIPKWKYNLLLCHVKLLMCRFSFVFSGKENLRSAFYDFEMESIISSFSKKLKDDVCRHITRKPKQNMICIGDHVYTLQVETPQPSRENYHDRTGGMVLRVGWVKGQLISKCVLVSPILLKNKGKHFDLSYHKVEFFC